MKAAVPTIQVTKDVLVIRIPWETLRSRAPGHDRQRVFTAEDVLRLVKSGRRAYRLGRTKVIGSLRDLMA